MNDSMNDTVVFLKKQSFNLFKSVIMNDPKTHSKDTHLSPPAAVMM